MSTEAARTYTVRPMGAGAWAGPGLSAEEGRRRVVEASRNGLPNVVMVCDQTGELYAYQSGAYLHADGHEEQIRDMDVAQ